MDQSDNFTLSSDCQSGFSIIETSIGDSSTRDFFSAYEFAPEADFFSVCFNGAGQYSFSCARNGAHFAPVSWRPPLS